MMSMMGRDGYNGRKCVMSVRCEELWGCLDLWRGSFVLVGSVMCGGVVVGSEMLIFDRLVG